MDDARLADWSRRLRERIGLNVPALQLAVGNSLADELELASPRGRFSTGLFFADRRQVLKRQWEAEFGDAQPSGTTSCFDDASGEDVFWLPPTEVRSDYPGAVRDFDEAVVGWLEAHCRRSFALLFDTGVLIGLVRELAPSFGRPTTVGEVRRLRQVVIDLVEEGVPFGPRREVVLEELARLLPQGMQSEVVTQRIREQVQADLCRAVADESGRFTTILLDEQAEQVLVEKRIGVSGERTVLRLRPAEAQDLASAISGAVLGILQDGRRPAPVLVTLPDLRPSLSRLLRRFDHRMRVLSFTELDPEFVTESGVVVSVPMLTGDGT